MKKNPMIMFLFMLFLAFVGGGYAQAQQKTPANHKKVLVVYYSYSGNTREIATQIHQKIGGDIVEIKTVKPYPKVYNELTAQAKKELESGFKPDIQPISVNVKDYDTVFVGSPNWWVTIAPPVITFLSKNDLSGKTVIPFITHEGSGLGRSVSHIKEICPKATVKDGLAVRGSSVKSAQKDVEQWLKKLGIIK